MDPLDVLLAAMRRRLEEGDEAGAVALAKAAAPYVHPRAAVRATGRNGNGTAVERMEDAELDGADGGAGAEAEDPDEPG